MCTPLAFAVIVATFGAAFQHGFHIGFVNISELMYMLWYGEINRDRRNDGSATDVTMLWSATLASFAIGAFLGGAGIHLFANSFGRKTSMLCTNGVVLIGVIVTTFSPFSNSYELFIVGRFVIGISVGLNSGVCPIYLIEIAPDNCRGAVGTTYGVMVALALLIGQVFSLPIVLGKPKLWAAAMALTIVPSLLQMVALLFCPESPKFLYIDKEEQGEAKEALDWLTGTAEMDEELDKLRDEAKVLNEVDEVTCGSLCDNEIVRNPLIICTIIMVGYHICGSTTFFYFSCAMLDKLGFTPANQHYITLGLGSINLFMSVMCMLFVEVLGRRTLLLISFVGMTLITIGLTIAYVFFDEKNEDRSTIVAYVVTSFMYCFVVFFGIGAPIAWFYTPELNNYNARTRVTSVVVSVGWLMDFCVSMTTMILYAAIGHYTFLFFLVANLFTFILICFTMLETKNLSAIEIMEII